MIMIIKGIGAGILAGILMGLVSEVLFRMRLFKSSLILIDSEFFFRAIKIKSGFVGHYIIGTIIHLITSGVFGGIYIIGTILVSLNAYSVLLIAIYFFILWLSMLFIALPVAGQGLMGRKAGPFTWFEQLVLHCVFGIGYFIFLQIV